VVYEPLAIADQSNSAASRRYGRSGPPAVGAARIFTSPGCEPSGRLVQIETSDESAEKPSGRIDGLTSSRMSPSRQIAVGAAADLADPSVHLPIPLRQKRHEFPVREEIAAALLGAGEVRQAE